MLPCFLDTTNDFHVGFVVSDQDDLLERIDLLVVIELLTSIVVLRGRTEDLYDEARIDRRMLPTVFWIYFEPATHNRHVGVR